MRSTKPKEDTGKVESVFAISPVSRKAWMLPLILQKLKIRSENTRLWSAMKAIRFEFWMKEALVTAEICVLCGWEFSNQFDIVLETIQLAVSCSELYFARCCALKRTETWRRKARLCVYNWFEKWCFDVSFLTSIRLCKQFILGQKKVEFLK